MSSMKQISDKEYFSHEALNASKLKKYIKSPARAIHDDFKGSKATVLGSLVHCLVFEAQEVANRYVAEPKKVTPEMLTLPEHVVIQKPLEEVLLIEGTVIVPSEFITTSGTVAVKKQAQYQSFCDGYPNAIFIHSEKEAFDLLVQKAKEIGATIIGNYKQLVNAWEFEQAVKGILIMGRSDYAKALWIFRSIKKHKHAKKLLWHKAGKPEIAFFAQVPEFDEQLCKGKFDYYISSKDPQGNDLNMILDLKTIGRDSHINLELLSSDTREVTENKIRLGFEDLGYDMSLAFYNLLHKAVTGSPATHFIIIAVQTDKYPYEVFEIRIDPDWIKLGEFKVKKLYKLYKKCLENNFYPKIDQLRWNEELTDWEFIKDGLSFTIKPSERQLKKLENLKV